MVVDDGAEKKMRRRRRRSGDLAAWPFPLIKEIYYFQS